MTRFATAVSAGLLLACPLMGQTPAAAPGPAPQAAQAAHPIPPAEQQIAAAVLPLPESMRAGARVFGYASDGRFVELRAGTGMMTCLADDPRDDRFHVACYHNSMEGYMARGRELRAQGMNNPEARDSVRKADVLAGRIHLPSTAALYSLSGPAGSYDPATNSVHGTRPLFVIYVPFATSETLGLPTVARGQPWVMHPGEPGAHIMYVPTMP